MVASRAHDAVMVCRFEAARRLNNAVLGDGLKALALMRESKAWTAAKAMPKGEPKSAVRDARNALGVFTTLDAFAFTRSSRPKGLLLDHPPPGV